MMPRTSGCGMERAAASLTRFISGNQKNMPGRLYWWSAQGEAAQVSSSSPSDMLRRYSFITIPMLWPKWVTDAVFRFTTPSLMDMHHCGRFLGQYLSLKRRVSPHHLYSSKMVRRFPTLNSLSSPRDTITVSLSWAPQIPIIDLQPCSPPTNDVPL